MGTSKPPANLLDGVTVRILNPEDLESLPRFWIQDVGIPIELRFIKRWYASDPEGFRVAVDSRDRIIGMASIMKQTDQLYVMGYMGVAKRYRGKGVGRMLLDNLLARSQPANCALSASEDKLDMYIRRGFKKVENLSGYSYIGKLNIVKNQPPLPLDLDIVHVKPGDALLAEVTAYDATVCGFQRNVELIQFTEPTSIVLAVKRQGKVVAYGKVQKYMLGGIWLGPVYGDEMYIASHLIEALMRQFEKDRSPFVFAIFSAKAQPIAKSLNLKLVDKLRRCYLDTSPENLPPVKMENVYAFDDVGFTFL
ncbi:uncharacterized protein LOC111264655 [Varroa jacobsoni]|uniref:uncharacterized protein LOC111264655 n=1 Tax=Varroa jacobsoni TaxID=62625 RepID=UPI000BF56C40|nr:uncharacterized protein LOC111264655 [Varroa jacobsoni]